MDDDARVGGYLNALSICHYVYAGLSFCFSGFGLFYVLMGQFAGWAIENVPQRPGEPEPPPPELFTWFFSIIGFGVMAAAVTVAVLCFLSARGMARRRNRTLSLVVAGVLCLTGLIGIALAVFTFVVLLKPETERLYAAAETR